MAAEVKLIVTTTRQYSMTLMKKDLIALLMGKSQRLPYDLSKNTAMIIRIPGGGDYSNMTMDIDEVGGLEVCWTVEEVSK